MSSSFESPAGEEFAPIDIYLVCPSPGAEVLLIDGQMRLVKRRLNELHVSTAPGVYTARVAIGDAVLDREIVARPGDALNLLLDAPEAPLPASALSRVYREQAFQIPHQTGGESALVLLAGELTPEGPGPLLRSLTLLAADGSSAHSFQPTSINSLRLSPGFYRLRSGSGDAAVEMSVYILAGWRTEIYLTSRPASEGPAEFDIANASVLWSRSDRPFEPDRPDLEVLDAVRSASRSRRRLITDAGLRQGLYEKFENPMLGLFSAHALLRRKSIDPGLLSEVTRNLSRILGDLPDVVALKLALDADADVAPVELPPVLRWSWELLLEHSASRPGLLRPDSFAAGIAPRVTSGGTWMSWLSSPTAAEAPMRRPATPRRSPASTLGVHPMNPQKRRDYNERFLERLLKRRPQEKEHYDKLLEVPPAAALEAFPLEGEFVTARDLALETIVDRERPVLFVRDGQFDTQEVTILGPEATNLVDRMKTAGDRLLPLLPLIGRIDVLNFPGLEFVGTGWFVDTDIVVTNRHVASLVARWDGRTFAFSRGVGGKLLEASLCNAHEFDDLVPDSTRLFKVKEVLYIESDTGPNDIAFLRVDRRTDGAALPSIPVDATDVAADVPVCVIGYPARASKRLIPDQALMDDLFRGRFDVKRAAPGFSSGFQSGASTHDCSTLGGNSGSVVVDLATGRAVGLHFAGLYKENNFAVPASVLTDYIRRKRWNRPPEIELPRPTPSPAVAVPQATAAVPATGSVTITIPLTITVSLGAPTSAPPPPTPQTSIDPSQVEEAAARFWDQRPQGVLAVRVGYFDDGGRIGDRPCIAASVASGKLPAFESTGPREFQGVPIRYFPADISEQLDAHPLVESVDSIAYDDDARTGARFSFAPVEENMRVVLHVGPEYSWDQLQKFFAGARGRMVSAIYEFHGVHIKDAIEARLRDGASMTLVLDNASFSAVKDETEEFDRQKVFEEWANTFTFNRIVAPEGARGLISDSYHIKVTVRDDDVFWLSSGNWKEGSSQPVITQEQRDNATDEDLPGNREWHVVVKNKTLATRFRSHILQDQARSLELGGGPLPPRLRREESIFVDVPLEETIALERRPPSRILQPAVIDRTVRVQPLLTPDREGAVYSEAVLALIDSAKKSLLFQIPYIAMPSNPRAHRGFIDDLLRALTRKLKNLEDARVILRSGGSQFSSPAHAAWYFKSKGVDIESRLRVIDNHHTKGMIVDGRRVLLGSHNWSKPGVTLNRDASLLFDDAEIAAYYTQAFEIDWARSNPIKPRQFVRESVILEAVGAEPPAGFRRVRLADLLKDD